MNKWMHKGMNTNIPEDKHVGKNEKKKTRNVLCAEQTPNEMWFGIWYH